MGNQCKFWSPVVNTTNKITAQSLISLFSNYDCSHPHYGITQSVLSCSPLPWLQPNFSVLEKPYPASPRSMLSEWWMILVLQKGSGWTEQCPSLCWHRAEQRAGISHRGKARHGQHKEETVIFCVNDPARKIQLPIWYSPLSLCLCWSQTPEEQLWNKKCMESCTVKERIFWESFLAEHLQLLNKPLRKVSKTVHGTGWTATSWCPLPLESWFFRKQTKTWQQPQVSTATRIDVQFEGHFKATVVHQAGLDVQFGKRGFKRK